MQKTIITTKNAPAAIGPYSQAVKFGQLIFTSGQIALDPISGEIVGENISEQTNQVLKNLQAVLAAENITFDNVIKATVFLDDMANFADFNKIYMNYFTNDFPARSCVAVKTLPKNVKVEIELIAHC